MYIIIYNDGVEGKDGREWGQGSPSERVQTLAGWGAHADMPSIVLLRMHACTVQAARGPGCCFQKRKNYDV